MNSIICDRYQSIRILNAGLFSTIYLAQALKLPEKPTCILKQFKPQTDDRNLLKIAKELFEREAKALRQIGQHPQIPQILDYFEVDGNLYLVREYIPGETLREFQNHDLWSEKQVIEFLESMLPVLAFIHQQEIIHRDIKPENIILRPLDQKPCLIDFGAVKLRSQTTQANTSPTIIHSYGYTPPEQLEGYAEKHSDLYALGMTCIEMLLGEKPASFTQIGENGNGVIEKLEKLGISEELRSLLNQLTYLDARQRYQNADAVVADLNQLKINCESARSKGYTSTLISCSEGSPGLGYTSTQLSIDSLPEEPTVKTQNARHKAANLQHQSARSQLPQRVDPAELRRILSQSLDYETRESQICKITTSVKVTLVKRSRVLLLGISCFAIGAALLYFFYFKATSIQSSTHASTSIDYDSNQKTENLPRFQVVTQLQGDTSSIRFLKFTEGQTLVSASRSGLIQLHKLQNATVQQLTKTSSEILAAARDQQGELLAFATADRSIELWNLKTMKQVQQAPTEQLIWSLAMGNTRSSLIAGGLSMVERWNVFPSELKLTETLEFAAEKPEPIRSIALSADSSVLAAGDAAGNIKIVQFDFSRTQFFHAHAKAVNAVAMNASETMLLSGSDDDTIRIWNLDELQEYDRPVIRAELGGVTAIASHPNSNIVAAGGIYGTVKLWNWQTGQLLGMLSELATEITALTFSPDGNSLAVGTRDGKITIFSVAQ